MTNKGQKRRKERKEILINYFGNKCFRCGLENGHWAIWHFHHVNKEDKLYGISEYLMKNITDFEHIAIPEAKEKCVMLCANCHAIVNSNKDEADILASQWHVLKSRSKDRLEKIINRGLLITGLNQLIN